MRRRVHSWVSLYLLQASEVGPHDHVQICESVYTLIFPLGLETMQRCLTMTDAAISAASRHHQALYRKHLLYIMLRKICQKLHARASGQPVPTLASSPDFDAGACLHDASPLATWLGLQQAPAGHGLESAACALWCMCSDNDRLQGSRPCRRLWSFRLAFSKNCTVWQCWCIAMLLCSLAGHKPRFYSQDSSETRQHRQQSMSVFAWCAV